MSFGDIERKVKDTFIIGSNFKFNGEYYTVIKSGKPTTSKGEPKTDVYVLAKNQDREIELKISVKQDNADFLENKITLERANEIFGENTNKILSSSISKIKEVFEEDYLIFLEKKGKTEKGSFTLGWKFELTNKKGGHKSGELELSQEQKESIFSGVNLNKNKKDATVNGELIKNSGVANFIFEVPESWNGNSQDVIDKIIPISEYAKGIKIYFACKALNFRIESNKWDGDRPLVVYVDWSIDDNKLSSKIIFDQPLEKKGNEIGKNLQSLLHKMNINKENYNNLNNLVKNTNIFCSL